MAVFGKNEQRITINFKSRAEAFAYMLDFLINDKNTDPSEAVKKADDFANTFATNMGLPLKEEPELSGVDKYISYAEKIGAYLNEHPKVIEYAVPAVTFIIGLFTGKKVDDVKCDNQPYQSIRVPPGQSQETPEQQEPQKQPIDFDKID